MNLIETERLVRKITDVLQHSPMYKKKSSEEMTTSSLAVV